MSINPSINVASSNNASFDRPSPSDAMSIDTTIKQSINQSTFPGCCVCRTVDDENLLHCRGCSINVHPACIGIPHIVDWLCCKCEYLSNDPSINQSTIECFACGQRSGYLVPTDDDRWVDIMCGTWLQGSPGPTWSSDDQGAIIQLNDAHLIDQSLSNQTCTICQSNFGYCFRCSYESITQSGKQRCNQYFHPTCAQRAGLTLQVESKDGDDDSQYLHAYCSKHSELDDVEIGSLDQTEIRINEQSNVQSGNSKSNNQSSNQISIQSLDQSNTKSINQSNNQFHHANTYSDLSFSPSKRSSPFSSNLPVMPTTSLASYRSRESSPSITEISNQTNNRKNSKTINPTTSKAVRQGHSFPYQSPMGSPMASPSMSSATSPANHLAVNQSTSQSTEELVDHFTDKRTFHNLIEAYMRPIAAVDLLRLGQLFPPPSKRSRPITQSASQSSSQVRKARQKQPAHIHPVRQSITQSTNQSTSQSSTRQLQQKLESPHTSPRIDSVGATIDMSTSQPMHQLDLSSNQATNQQGRPLSHPPRRIPFVPFERDPSLLIPYRGLSDTMWSGDQSFTQSISQLPHMPSIHDLPHISALMGTDITVCNLQSMRAERVSTAPAVVVKPAGAYIIDEDTSVIQPNNPSSTQTNSPSNTQSVNQSNDDAWVFRPTGQRIVYPFLPPGEVIKPVVDRPLDFLHCDAKAVLERSSSPTTRIHVLLNTSDGMEFDQSIDQSINATINQTISQSKRSSFIEYRGVWNENWQDVDQPLFKDAELQGFQPVDAEGFAEELRRVQLPPIGQFNASVDQSNGQSFDQSPDHNPPVDPDELLRELISCQQELMQQVQSNVVRRNQISSQISWQDYIDYQTELAIHEEKTIGCYNSAVAWHTFRHSMADGMKDAVIPKHVLISQVAQAKREIKAAFIEPAAVTSYKLTTNQAITQSTNQSIEQSSLSDDAPDNDIDEFVTCCVCFDNTSSEKNPMLYCDRCSLTVHRVCYGVSALPENDWYCQYCEYQRNQAKSTKRKSNTQSINQSESASSPVAPSAVYPCALCPYRGGALKPTTDKRWCHILCALLVSGARLHDLARLEPIKGVDDALKNQVRHGATCCVCRIDWGACVFCVHPGCGLAFHSYCGWLQGFYYEAELQDIDIKFITFCPHHTPDKALSEVKVAQLNILNNASTPAASPQTSPHLTSTALYDPVLSRPSVADARLDVDQLSQDPNSWIPTSAADFVVTSPFQSMSGDPVGTPIFARQESSMSTMSISASSPSPSLPPPAAYPRHVLINLRLFQQRDIRNRAREDRRPKDTKKKRRRIEKRRLERSRALHEDLYPIGKCAICFMSDEQLQQQIQFNADSHNLPNRKRLNRSTWTEIISPVPSSAYPHNQLLRCDQCGVEVHQSCYGVTDSALESMKARRAAAVAEKGDDLDDELMSTGFNCMRCAAQCRDVKCELCPRKGGALKPISEGSSKVQGWVHTLCALWFEELKFKDPVTLSGVEGINSISKMKRRMRCGLCKRGGLCLPCSEPNCEEALHPICGMFAGVFMQMYADSKNDQSANPPTKSSHKSMKRLLYCPRHTPVPLARFISIPHSFALMTTLRRELDVARLLLDTMRRREKIKQSLMLTEFDIQSARWDQTLKQCREARISSSAVAAPSKTKDNVIKFKISRASKQASSQANSPPLVASRTLTDTADTTPVVPTAQADNNVDDEQHVDSVISHSLIEQVDQSSDMLVDQPVTPNTETERRSSRRASHQEPSPQLTPLPTPRRKRHSIDVDSDAKSPTSKRARHITSSQSLSAAVAPLDETEAEPSVDSSETVEPSNEPVNDESTSTSTDATPAPRKRGPKPGSKHKSSKHSKSTPSTEPRKRGRPKSAARQAREALGTSGADESSDGRGRKRKTSRK